METIKIGRKEYEIKKGDYIGWNKVSYVFCSGDGRVLLRQGWDAYRFLAVPKSVMKTIDLSKMRYESADGLYGKYYFNVPTLQGESK